METFDILNSDATALAGAIREGLVSSVEVIDAHLSHIEKVNSSINAFITVLADDACSLASLCQ
jgi:Asp-tRNA(Asn)/Glu-tRNA(Gln) amidotransferase A subunit family amidase